MYIGAFYVNLFDRTFYNKISITRLYKKVNQLKLLAPPVLCKETCYIEHIYKFRNGDNKKIQNLILKQLFILKKNYRIKKI
jgi:hypothetical protein